MPVAIISDIHGNLIALDAVLDAIAARQIQQIICLGDVAADEARRTVDQAGDSQRQREWIHLQGVSWSAGTLWADPRENSATLSRGKRDHGTIESNRAGSLGGRGASQPI